MSQREIVIVPYLSSNGIDSLRDRRDGGIRDIKVRPVIQSTENAIVVSRFHEKRLTPTMRKNARRLLSLSQLDEE
jgi:hypothetical protein